MSLETGHGRCTLHYCRREHRAFCRSHGCWSALDVDYLAHVSHSLSRCGENSHHRVWLGPGVRDLGVAQAQAHSKWPVCNWLRAECALELLSQQLWPARPAAKAALLTRPALTHWILDLLRAWNGCRVHPPQQGRRAAIQDPFDWSCLRFHADYIGLVRDCRSFH